MAAGFWRKLFAVSLQEEAKTLKEEEARLLLEKGHVRRRYICSGRVQEVGFRYTAFYLAQEMGLSGWVSNLDDGRVELQLQGRPETIELLLCRIDGHGRISITGMEQEEVPLLEENGFTVRG